MLHPPSSVKGAQATGTQCLRRWLRNPFLLRWRQRPWAGALQSCSPAVTSKLAAEGRRGPRNGWGSKRQGRQVNMGDGRLPSKQSTAARSSPPCLYLLQCDRLDPGNHEVSAGTHTRCAQELEDKAHGGLDTSPLVNQSMTWVHTHQKHTDFTSKCHLKIIYKLLSPNNPHKKFNTEIIYNSMLKYFSEMQITRMYLYTQM